MEQNLGTEKISRLLISYGIPAIASSLISALYNLIDQIFIGQKIGYIGNAATQACFPVTALCGSLSLLFGIGCAVMFNIMQGRNQKEQAMRFAGAGLFLLALSGIITGIVIGLCAPAVVALLGATQESYEMALMYLRIIAVGIPFVVFTTGATLLIRSDGSPKFALLCSVVGTGLNIILDYLFIFPLDMGIKGAALATVTGQITVFFMIIWYLRRFKTGSFEKNMFKSDKKMTAKIASIGAAGSLNQAAMLIVQIAINNSLRIYGEMSVYGGSEALAACGVVTKINMIFYFVMIGMSIGGEPIVGFNFGAGKYDRVIEVYRKTLAFTLIVGALETCLFWICPDFLLSVFGEGNELYYDFALKYMHIFMLFVIVSGVPAVSMNLLSSIGKAKKGIYISLSKQIVLLVAVMILPLFSEINGVLFAGIAADIFACIFSFAVLKPEFEKMKRIE